MAVANVTNAAVTGAMAAVMAERGNVSAVSTTYDSQATAANNFATALALILDDTTVDSVAKTNLLGAICCGLLYGRPITSDPSFTVEAAAAKACYTSAAAKLV
jgi:hypothetical protein